MNIKKCTLVEKYKGYEIFVDRDTSRFWLVNKKRGVEEEFEGIWSAKEFIKKSLTTHVDNVEAITPTSYFGNSLSKVVVLSKYTNGEYKYKMIESTDNSYDVGKTEKDKISLYPMSSNNIKIYDEVTKLNKEKDKLTSQQRKLVSTLKVGKKLKV